MCGGGGGWRQQLHERTQHTVVPDDVHVPEADRVHELPAADAVRGHDAHNCTRSDDDRAVTTAVSEDRSTEEEEGRRVERASGG